TGEYALPRARARNVPGLRRTHAGRLQSQRRGMLLGQVAAGSKGATRNAPIRVWRQIPLHAVRDREYAQGIPPTLVVLLQHTSRIASCGDLDQASQRAAGSIDLWRRT